MWTGTTTMKTLLPFVMTLLITDTVTGKPDCRKEPGIPICRFINGIRRLMVSDNTNVKIGREVADSAVSVSIDLFKIILQKKEGNVISSPISVATLLAMLQQGAEEKTLVELNHVLHASPDLTREGYGTLSRGLQLRHGNATLEFANGAFLHERFRILREFRQTLKEDFLAEIESVDFADNIYAAKRINSWVAEKTHNKIKKLFKEDSLSSDTLLVLINAIYFKDMWLHGFVKGDTRYKNFYSTPNNIIKVPMMHLQDELCVRNVPELSSSWLELPFQVDHFSLLVVLPNYRGGIDYLANKISPRLISTIIHQLDRCYKSRVHVRIPKFNLKTELNLKKSLQKLGLKHTFGSANFKGIANGNVYVSEVVQKAEIEIDEKGATAAAATGAIVVPVSGIGIGHRIFNANRPFLAFIVDKYNKVPLFAARVTNPLEN